jgi:hypothetical protein
MNEQDLVSKPAIRNQLERTQYLEHSVPLYSRLVLYLKMPKTCASFAEEKTGIFSRYSNPNNNEFISKVCAMEGAAAGFALHLVWLRCIQPGCFIEFWRSHCFFEQCFGATHCCLLIIFKMEHTNLVF